MQPVHRRDVGVEAGRLGMLEAGAGAPVVLLHGIPTGAELWRDCLPLLASAGFHGLALDLPGYGTTRLAAAADHSLVGCADLIAGWLAASEHGPAWVVGHDAGGAVAQLLAVRAPDQVARLTLTNSIAAGCWPAPRARASTVAAKLGLYRPGARLGLVPNPYMRREIRRAFADPERAREIDQDRVFWDGKVSDASGRDAFQRHLAALSPDDTADLPERLPDVPMPVELVWGLEDPFQPWDPVGRRLQAMLPPARVTRLEGCGHFAPLECPQRLCSALLDAPA